MSGWVPPRLRPLLGNDLAAIVKCGKIIIDGFQVFLQLLIPILLNMKDDPTYIYTYIF